MPPGTPVPTWARPAAFLPDGTKIAVNRKAQSYWRKYYRGAYQSDVTVMDLSTKTFKDLTDFDGMDSWPLWSNDGRVYFVSDRDPNAQANLWFVPESGGNAVKVTDFKDGDVRFPSISSDGKTIVFERDYGISKVDLATKVVTPLHFDIAAETQESLTEFRDFNSTVDDYDVAPNGQRVAFTVHGRIFTAPTGETGELRQITDGPVRDQNLSYSPDGKLLAFVSDKTGREEIYVTNPDGSGDPRKITDIDALKGGYLWSPDSKSTGVHHLRGQTLDDHRRGARPTRRLASLEVWKHQPTRLVARRQVARLQHVRRLPIERYLPHPRPRRRPGEGDVRLPQRDEPPVLQRLEEALLHPGRGGHGRRWGRCSAVVANLLHPA